MRADARWMSISGRASSSRILCRENGMGPIAAQQSGMDHGHVREDRAEGLDRAFRLAPICT